MPNHATAWTQENYENYDNDENYENHDDGGIDGDDAMDGMEYVIISTIKIVIVFANKVIIFTHLKNRLEWRIWCLSPILLLSSSRPGTYFCLFSIVCWGRAHPGLENYSQLQFNYHEPG